MVKVGIQGEEATTVEGIKAVLDELSPKLPAAKTAQPRYFMDTRFIEELNGFIDRLYK